jgi:hypothetical protein
VGLESVRKRMTLRVFALWRRWAMPGHPDGNGGYPFTVDLAAMRSPP